MSEVPPVVQLAFGVAPLAGAAVFALGCGIAALARAALHWYRRPRFPRAWTVRQ